MHSGQTYASLNYVFIKNWCGSLQDGTIQEKQASVGDSLNKMRTKTMIYPDTDLHFWSPPIWVYSGRHLLWWYMQPQWWSKWCLVLAHQWPFPLGDGGGGGQEGKKWQMVLKMQCFDTIFLSCRNSKLQTQCSFYPLSHDMRCTWRLSLLVIENRHSIKSTLPGRSPWWEKGH